MMPNAEIATVVVWHHALNAGAVDCLVALSSPDVEVGGPRGAGRGVSLLRAWVGCAGLRLEPRAMFQRGSAVVVEQDAEWRAPDSGDSTGRQVLASVFRVADGRVTSVIRFPDLASALAAIGLTVADRVVGTGRRDAVWCDNSVRLAPLREMRARRSVQSHTAAVR